MVAAVSPHRTHASRVGYVAHLLVWWVMSALATYGLCAYGAAYRVDWAERMPRYWRSEARRGLRDCERILKGC